MPKRKRQHNRGAVFVDLDNFRKTAEAYRELGVRGLTLSKLLDWIMQPQLGLTRVTQIHVFGTYERPLRPAGRETLLERRHVGDVNMINFPMPQEPGVPGYEDVRILEVMEKNRVYWDTAIIVSSDHIFFDWADRIRRDVAPFHGKEAVNIYSHLSASTYYAATARNAESLEDIFPRLVPFYIEHRRHNPLEIGNLERLSA